MADLSSEPLPNLFTGTDVLAILRENSWLTADATPEQISWAERAAALLGPQSTDRAALTDLLQLVFCYDAHTILESPDAHAILARQDARKVLRYLSLSLLDSEPLTSAHFQEIVTQLKTDLDVRSRDLFHPIRLAVTGRAGEGGLDRVILLLEEASVLPFATHVKSPRTRILEFCSALD